MRAAARIQAAIDLLDAIIVAARDGGASADTIAKEYFRTRRYMGSKDRRAVREHCYAVIRHIGERPKSGREAMVRYALFAGDDDVQHLFDGSQYGPAAITDKEREQAHKAAHIGAIPSWLSAHLPDWLDEKEQSALFDRAPLDIRMNGLQASELIDAFPDAQRDKDLPNAARLKAGTQLAEHALWRAGKIDIQDKGSQHIVAACDPGTHRHMIDLCAGAGGKALGLAALAGPDAHILACDTSRARLSALPQRAQRLHIDTIITRLLNPQKEMEALSDWEGRADMVLVDAPCSGTGTWRRSPETRWRLNAARLTQLLELQSHILNYAHKLLKPGGMLVYAVCSLLAEEGPDQIASFLEGHDGWGVDIDAITVGRPVRARDIHENESAHGIVLSPLHDQTDGFFFTRLRKPC